jgi:hypothetical protein
MTTSDRRMRQGGDTVNHKGNDKINTGNDQQYMLQSRNNSSTDNRTVLTSTSKESRQRVTDLGYPYD